MPDKEINLGRLGSKVWPFSPLVIAVAISAYGLFSNRTDLNSYDLLGVIALVTTGAVVSMGVISRSYKYSEDIERVNDRATVHVALSSINSIRSSRIKAIMMSCLIPSSTGEGVMKRFLEHVTLNDDRDDEDEYRAISVLSMIEMAGLSSKGKLRQELIQILREDLQKQPGFSSSTESSIEI
jgi:hypothetical protein